MPENRFNAYWSIIDRHEGPPDTNATSSGNVSGLNESNLVESPVLSPPDEVVNPQVEAEKTVQTPPAQ